MTLLRIARRPGYWMLIAAAGTIGFLLSSTLFVGTAGEHEQSDQFWAMATVRGMAAEEFGSMEEMTASADVVVVGRLVSLEGGREWVANPRLAADPKLRELGMARFATAHIEVERTLKATKVTYQDTIPLEIFMWRPDLLDDLQSVLPGERALFFLRNKGVTDSPLYYRFVNDSQGLVRDLDGKAHVSPSSDAPFILEQDGSSFNELVALIEAAAH